MDIVNATADDAPELAYLINLAGEGIPEYIWRGMAENNETPMEVGARRAARKDGGFSYLNAKAIRQDNQLSGMIISYQLDDPYNIGDLNDYPEIVRPLIELEAMAPGSWYINAIATHENFRGLGIAKTLLFDAEEQARAANTDNMSIIVASENKPAKQLYLNAGYIFKASLPVVSFPGSMHGGNWELLVKPVN